MTLYAITAELARVAAAHFALAVLAYRLANMRIAATVSATILIIGAAVVIWFCAAAVLP
jgi:hypothetical protein